MYIAAASVENQQQLQLRLACGATMTCECDTRVVRTAASPAGNGRPGLQPARGAHDKLGAGWSTAHLAGPTGDPAGPRADQLVCEHHTHAATGLAQLYC